MKTIDEMLTEVAKNLNVQSSITPYNKPVKKDTLDLESAKLLANAAETAAKSLGLKIVVAVVNSGANLILLHAMDDSYIASVKASQDKAYTAAALKMPTSQALKESRGGGLDGLTNGNGILLLAGGEPIFTDGTLAGAIGVSGGTKEQDELVAKVAVKIFNSSL